MTSVSFPTPAEISAGKPANDPPYNTSNLTLAAFLLERQVSLVDSDARDGTVWFRFRNQPACLDLEKEFHYGRPMVEVRTFMSKLNELRDLLREHRGSGPLRTNRS